MSNLTDFFGKSAKRVAGDSPHSQAAFMVRTGDGTFTESLLFSHDLQCIHRTTTLTNTTDAMTEFSNAAGIWNHATQITSQEASTGGIGASMNGYLGNHHLDIGANGITNASRERVSVHPVQTIQHSTACVGTNLGLNQSYALSTSYIAAGTACYIKVTPRSVRHVLNQAAGNYGGFQSSTGLDLVRVQAEGMMTANYRLASGGFSYNQNSGNAVIIERENTGSRDWRPVLIKNFPDPAKYLSDWHAWGAAITSVTSVAANRVVGPTEGWMAAQGDTREFMGDHHAKAILCDNNDVVIMHHRTNGIGVARWRWNESNNQWDAPTVCSDTHTTNSGTNSVETPAPNWVQSLDGKTAILTSKAVYSGAGMYAVLVDVATGNMQRWAAKYTSGHLTIVPIGASKFLLSRGINSDGNGLSCSIISWDGLHSNPADDHSGAAYFDFNSLDWGYGWMDVGNKSTSYPNVIPISQVDNVAIVLAEKGEL